MATEVALGHTQTEGKTNKLISNHSYWLKLLRLLNHSGKETLLRIFHEKRSLPTEPADLYLALQKHRTKLQGLLDSGIIKQDQWEVLFPPSNKPNSTDFDLTLLKILIRNFTHLDAKSSLWDLKNIPIDDRKKMEELCKKKKKKQIIHIMLLSRKRNELFHYSGKNMSLYEFKIHWKEITEILDYLDYRSDQDKKVLEDLYNCPLEDVKKYKHAIMQSQLEALYSLIEQHATKEDVSGLKGDTSTLKGQLADYQKEMKMQLAQIAEELNDIRKTKSYDNFTEKVNNTYTKVTKVGTFIEDTDELMLVGEIPKGKLEQFQEDFEILKNLVNETKSQADSARKISESLSEKVSIIYSSYIYRSTSNLNEDCDEPTASASESEGGVIKNDETFSKLTMHPDHERKDYIIHMEKRIPDIRSLCRTLQLNVASLYELDLSSCDLKNEHAKILAKYIPFIEKVRIQRNKEIDSKGWKSISEHFLKNKEIAVLNYFDVRYNYCSNESFVALSDIIPFIETFLFSNNENLEEKSWEHLKTQLRQTKEHQQLAHLSIYGKPFGTKVSLVLSLIQYMKTLNLASNKFNKHILRYIVEEMEDWDLPWNEFNIKIDHIEFRNCFVTKNDFRVVNLLIHLTENSRKQKLIKHSSEINLLDKSSFPRAIRIADTFDEQSLYYVDVTKRVIVWNELHIQESSSETRGVIGELAKTFNIISNDGVRKETYV